MDSKKININVFNGTHINKNNYLYSFEIKQYKQLKRTVNAIKKHLKTQKSNDYNQLTIRFYVFESNTFLFKENEILKMYN